MSFIFPPLGFSLFIIPLFKKIITSLKKSEILTRENLTWVNKTQRNRSPRARSGSGSDFPDVDPHQYYADPQHWFKHHWIEERDLLNDR